ncbi:HARB1 nuclease, partial [Amia calva]|nr:HARB1 nuclease [Amia calva]
TARSYAVPVPLQVLTTLGFLATGSFQRELADRSGISKLSLSRAMPAVWDGIICMSTSYIRFPYDAVDQPNKAQFAATVFFTNVIGAIDCTHIAIKAPSEEEFAYVNRKHFHSINVQIKPMIHILTNSMVGMTLQAGRVRNGWLLGERSWLSTRWLLTPLTNPQTDQEYSYNDAHSRTLSVVERAIGQLKCRWRCLDRTGGMVLYRPDKVCRIVLACGVLHNVVHRHGIPLGEVAAPPDDPNPGPMYVQPNQQAIQARQHVIVTI